MQNQKLQDWITEVQNSLSAQMHLCLRWFRGRIHSLCNQLVEKKVFVPLNPNLRPGSSWCHSDPDDVASVEEATFICSKIKRVAGPTNNWVDARRDEEELLRLFKGCMHGRTIYVIPFCMGPLGSKMSKLESRLPILRMLSVVCTS